MPLYDYKCDECGHEWEEFAPMEKRHAIACPKCGHSPSRTTFRAGHAPYVEIFPSGIWRDIAPEPLEITSRRQLREKCKEHDCYAVYDDGIAPGF